MSEDKEYIICKEKFTPESSNYGWHYMFSVGEMFEVEHIMENGVRILDSNGLMSIYVTNKEVIKYFEPLDRKKKIGRIFEKL